MLVRCNWCYHIMEEENITVIDDEEYCPDCKKTGYLMDIKEEQTNVI